MAKFKVTIIETLEREVEVEAKSTEEAERKVRGDYKLAIHILDADDYTGTDFKTESLELVKNLELER